MDIKNFDELLRQIKTYIFDEEQINTITRAYLLAEELHKEQRRQSGEPYIIHPLNVAYILTQMHADAETVSAALLHDTIEDTAITKEEIEKQFGKEIATLVDGVTKMSKLNFTSEEEQIASNTRKIITSLDDDVRIVIIKLADRMHNIRTLQYKSKYKQRETALKTMEIFVPLAYCLGSYSIKSELENNSLAYLKRKKYAKIKDTLELMSDENDLVIAKSIEEVGNLLADNNMNFEIEKRIKSSSGIYEQLHVGKKISEIHDLLALKIMLDERMDCYHALGLIHEKYMPMNSEFKDLIARPKTNMYRSIHTTVFGPNDHFVQMQIRTKDMHKIDMQGLTAYWDLYGDNAKEKMQEDLQTQIKFFQGMNELNSFTSKNTEFVERIKKELAEIGLTEEMDIELSCGKEEGEE